MTRPAIAPATPWDDTQVLSTVSEQGTEPDSFTEQEVITEERISDAETPSTSENLKENPSSDDSAQDGLKVGNAID